jgi:predicted nucleic acid-binding Zn ribbon protein
MVLIMPTYEIQNQKTGEVKEVFCSWKDKDKELKKHGKDWIYLIGAPGLCFEGSVAKISKVSSGFKDVLKGIKKGSDKSNTMPNL